ncbi:hypothetical protein VPH35_012012 [Triticum aestivum]
MCRARLRHAGPNPAGPCPDLLGGASSLAPSAADRIFPNLAFAFSRRGGALLCIAPGCAWSSPVWCWPALCRATSLTASSSTYRPNVVAQVPPHVSLLWRCLCDYTGGTQVLWRRLGSCNLSIAPHDTGGVAALGSLGCAAPFDYVDGAVSWFGLLGDALWPCRWHTGAVVSSRLVCPFDCTPRHRWCRGVVYSWM